MRAGCLVYVFLRLLILDVSAHVARASPHTGLSFEALTRSNLGGSPGAYNIERYRQDFADIYFPAMALTGRPYGEPWCKDGISVRNLSFAISPQAGCDVWGRQKEQPCLVSVSLSFRSSYTSAARKDTLDESTMHYGILAKRLRAIKPSNDWQSIDQLADAVSQTILDTPPGSGLVKACQIEVHLPKASMLGDGVTFIRSTSFDNVASAAARRMLHLQNVRIPTLIGVNAHERTRKQPLIVSLWIDGLQYGTSETYPELETELVDVGEALFLHDFPALLFLLEFVDH